LTSSAFLMSQASVMGMCSLGAAAAQDEVLGDGVVAAFAKRLAAQDAPGTEGAATQGTETRYGNACIIGTGWMEAAAGAQHRAQPPFVEG